MMKSSPRIHVPVLLDVSTYISIAAMSLLGISGLPALNLQLIALGLCLLFGLLYHFYFRSKVYYRNPNLYFGVQSFVLALTFMLGSSATDAFNFLFLMLAIHTAVVLPGKTAIVWIAIYYGIVSSSVLFTRGLDGVYAVLFYLSAYVLSGFFGHTLQQAELARDRNQKLVDELKETQQKLRRKVLRQKSSSTTRMLRG